MCLFLGSYFITEEAFILELNNINSYFSEKQQDLALVANCKKNVFHVRASKL